MTRYFLLFMAVAFVANAQTQPPSHQDRAMQLLYQREIQAHAADLAAALQLQEQLAAVTKERDDLKKSESVSEPAAKQ